MFDENPKQIGRLEINLIVAEREETTTAIFSIDQQTNEIMVITTDDFGWTNRFYGKTLGAAIQEAIKKILHENSTKTEEVTNE